MIVKLEALRGLKTYIAEQIPDLAALPSGEERIVISQTPPDMGLHLPSLAIIPAGFRFTPSLEDIHDSTGATLESGEIVVCVGAWETRLQLRLAAANEYARHVLEETLTNLFFQREGAPGLLLTEVTACPQLGTFLASWDIPDVEWNEEFAFSAQEWAVLELVGTIPALVVRGGIYTMDDLRLGLTGDFNIPATSAGFDTIPGVVRVNDDGTLTPL